MFLYIVILSFVSFYIHLHLQIFASKNETIAEAIEKLLNRTKRRENTVDIITERLKEELKTLSDFLADLSQRRPGDAHFPSV